MQGQALDGNLLAQRAGGVADERRLPVLVTRLDVHGLDLKAEREGRRSVGEVLHPDVNVLDCDLQVGHDELRQLHEHALLLVVDGLRCSAPLFELVEGGLFGVPLKHGQRFRIRLGRCR